MRVSLPTARPVVVKIARTPTPTRRPEVAPERAPRNDATSGTATYYSGARGAYGPLVGLYAASHDHPGHARLRVSHGERSVVVTVLDYGPDPRDATVIREHRIIDLCPAAFAALAPLGAGVIAVTVERVS